MINRAPFAQVTAGEPLNFSASEHNAFIDAAQNYRLKGQLARSIVGDPILLHNDDEGFSYEIGDVVRIVKEFSTAEDSDLNQGKKPLFRTWTVAPISVLDPRNTIYAILTEALPATVGALAEGTIHDIVLATVNLVDITHRYARPFQGRLESTTDPLGPFVIVGDVDANNTAGVYDMHVWQRGVTSIVRRITVTDDAGIPAQGSGEITFELDSGPEQWLGANHTATGYLFIDGGEAVSKEKQGFASYSPENDKWFIIAIDCETPPTPAPPAHGDDITATISPNNTQDNCHQLAFKVNRITTCANDDDAVQLPADFGQGDPPIHIVNTGAKRLKIIPSDSDNIDNGTAGDAGGFATLPAGASVFYSLVRTDKWVS